MFQSYYRNKSGSLKEQEMLWEHQLQVSVSTAFSQSPKLSQVTVFIKQLDYEPKANITHAIRERVI